MGIEKNLKWRMNREKRTEIEMIKRIQKKVQIEKTIKMKKT
jgi:hypothetical protein